MITEKQIERFRAFCQVSDCATCKYVKYKDRGERYACAIAWTVENTICGNSAAMRGALLEIDRAVWHGGRTTRGEKDAHWLATSAITVPPRNCDVGTAEEQGTRCLAAFRAWRRQFEGDKLITAIMKWSQEPYEAERNDLSDDLCLNEPC